MSIKRFIQNKLAHNASKADEPQANRAGYSLNLNGEEFFCHIGETVLDALLRQKADVPYACRHQICQTCIMRSLNCSPPAESQITLRDTLQKLDYFLACACIPTQDMEIVLQESITREVAAKVVQIEKLNASVMSIFLQCEQPLDYRAGQTLILMNKQNQGKSYHITSVSSEKESGMLEIHTQLISGSYFSDWLSQELKAGDDVKVCGPMGHHFYVSDRLQQPLIFIADGFGLSPLIGIVQDALEAGHTAPIFLFHSASVKEELYLVEDFIELANCCENFAYYPITLNPDDNYLTGCAGELALRGIRDMSRYRVYICGSSIFVKQTQKEIYLSGASTKDIYSIFLSH